MKYSIRVDGIYDKRTLETLRGLGVNHIGLDLRPTSFNFIQHHVFFDLLPDIQRMGFSKIFLIFENEADFVIQKFLDDLKVVQCCESLLKQEFIFLDFRDLRSGEFYDQFQIPYIWTFDRTGKLAEFKESSLFRGVTVPYELIESSFQQGQIESFCQNMYQILGKKILTEKFIFDVKMNWNTNVIPSLFERFDFNLLTTQINSQVESCYRNVDIEALSRALKGHVGKKTNKRGRVENIIS